VKKKIFPSRYSIIESPLLRDKFGISNIARKHFSEQYPFFTEEGAAFIVGQNPNWLTEDRNFDFTEWPESKRITQSEQVRTLLNFLLREGKAFPKKAAILAGTKLEDAAKAWTISGLAKEITAYEHQADNFQLCNNTLDNCQNSLREMSPYKEDFFLSLRNENILTNCRGEGYGILDFDFCNNPLLKDEEGLVTTIGKNNCSLFATILTLHFGRGCRNKKEFLPFQLREFEHKLWDRYRLEIVLKNRLEYRRPGKGVGMASIAYVLEKQVVW